MGIQLSVLFGCVGGIELLACLKHVVVCKMQLIDDHSHCKVNYFHRAATIADDFVIIDKTSLEEENEHLACSEIEAILRQNKTEPNVLCIAPPSIEGYVRVPTPIPFGIDNEVLDEKSSSNSSLVDSGNENPTRMTPVENSPIAVKSCRGSSSDVSSLEDTENHVVKITTTKKILRRSKIPEVRSGSYEDYDVEDETTKHKKYLASNKKSFKPKLKMSELRRSAENLASSRRTKRQRDPERCKSDIQIQVSRNALRDEWTNTSPVASDVNLSNKKSMSVFIQTSFDDKLRENMLCQNSETMSCPNCRCTYDESSKIQKVTESNTVDGKPQLVKISSFEEASDIDYTKLRDTMTKKKTNWMEKVKSSVENESFDEYVDAEEEGMTFCEQPIQYSIPDHADDQAFWVNARSS